MHSRKHGKHGSHKPPRKKHSWMAYEKDEVQKLIEKFSKEGNSTARIGTMLRDQYGIPDVRVFGFKISKAAGKDSEMEDIHNLMVKAVNLHRHMEANKGDANTRHGLELLESKIRRLGKYYVKKGKLSSGWRYRIEEAKLLVK